MKKTLLICFIHGFQGGEDTFGSKAEFTEHLATLLAVELPKINIRTLVYPKFETRGDLADCVNRFRDWLLEKVIDIEVENGTPSPTVDPSVRVVLIGHSMGGIVAAETAIALTSDQPITDKVEDDPANFGLNGMMFPYIQGVLAFDTPYLGISPGVVAHGAEGHYNNAVATMTQLSGVAGMFGWGASQSQPAGSRSAGALPPPEKKEEKPTSPTSAWNSWGKIAMVAGAAGAIAAGSAAAYVNRQQITEGWTWVSSHLEFVGCLAKGQELKNRVAAMVRLNKELGVGFANLYTRLGKNADAKVVSMVGTVMGNQRTFCNLPAKQEAGFWKEAVNERADDETGAHMTMFDPHLNPGYKQLSEDAKNLITRWSRNEWYESSTMGALE